MSIGDSLSFDGVIQDLPFPIADGVNFKLCPLVPGWCAGDNGDVWSRVKAGSRWYPEGRLDNHWHKLTPQFNKETGYYLLTTSNAWDRKRRTFYIHKLILTSFRGPAPYRYVGRHMNGNKLDNRLENLLWGTKEEDRQDAIRNGVNNKGENNYKSALTEEAVALAKELRKTNMTYREITEIIKSKFNIKITESGVYQALNGNSWQHIREDKLLFHFLQKFKSFDEALVEFTRIATEFYKDH